jgi:hypothetical protein
VQPRQLTPIQAVQTRGRWRWWALAVVLVVLAGALVGAVVAIAQAGDDASAAMGMLRASAAVAAGFALPA